MTHMVSRNHRTLTQRNSPLLPHNTVEFITVLPTLFFLGLYCNFHAQSSSLCTLYLSQAPRRTDICFRCPTASQRYTSGDTAKSLLTRRPDTSNIFCRPAHIEINVYLDGPPTSPSLASCQHFPSGSSTAIQRLSATLVFALHVLAPCRRNLFSRATIYSPPRHLLKPSLSA